MKRVISLKEFSTTPTVSCMLRKDGNNVSTNNAGANANPNNGGGAGAQQHNNAADAKTQNVEPPKAAPKQEDMFEME